MADTPKRFNVRAYGLLIQDNKLLLSHEMVKGKHVTKFPGGGLEYGEGLVDCLIREFKEEMNIDIAIKEHFYTTDYFQRSYFKGGDQLISVYYLVDNIHNAPIPTIDEGFKNPEPEVGELLYFRWKHLRELQVEDVHLPVDQVVVKRLISNR